MKSIKRAALLAAVVVLCAFSVSKIKASYSDLKEGESYSVAYVVDGDTFKVRSGRHLLGVRLLGINSPETVDPRKKPECFGKEASNELKRILSDRKVELAFSPNREMKDKYGRFLAYAYLSSETIENGKERESFNGESINESLLKNGFAREYTFGSAYSKQREFREAEKEAKAGNKGLWGACK